MSQYEELNGGSGREMFFRAPRFKPGEIFGDRGPITNVNGTTHRIANMSMSGIAVYDSEKHYTQEHIKNETIVPVQMVTHNVTLHSGHGRLVRISPSGNGNIVGIQFTDQSANLRKISAEYKARKASDALQHNKRSSLDQVHRPYRLVCFDALEMLKRQKHILDSFETESAEHPQAQILQEEVLNIATQEFMPDWKDLTRVANRELRPIFADPEALKAAKQLTEATLTPELSSGQIWRRTYTKPLGYPGDYVIMNYVYDGADVGDTLFEKFSHRIGLEMLGCVASRKKVAESVIAAEMAKHSWKQGPFSVTNVACGGAEEMFQVLTKRECDVPAQVTLIDQDPAALTFAYERLHPLTVAADSALTVKCLHSSFVELMLGGALASSVSDQNLIYSLGLFDYLRTHRARRLVSTLYDHLKPGGLLLIGNLKNGLIADRWSAELICDWSMIYRTEEDMIELAKGLDAESIEVLSDEKKEVVLLKVRKPH